MLANVFATNFFAVDQFNGSTMVIPKVARNDLGAYLCIADNGVPPIMSKRVFLYVQFPPKIKISRQLVGVVMGNTIKIVCHISSYPPPLVLWYYKGISA